MKHPFKTGLFAFLMGTSSVYGVEYRADAQRLLKLQISQLGPTRLEFDSQKITDVFCYPEEAAKVVLNKSGFLFVVPKEGHTHVYVTIVGEEGATQDLRLKFAFKQPDPILLRADCASKVTRSKSDVKRRGEQSHDEKPSAQT